MVKRQRENLGRGGGSIQVASMVPSVGEDKSQKGAGPSLSLAKVVENHLKDRPTGEGV